MKQTPVMRSTLGRLPAYLQYLKGLDPKENENVSATVIAKALGLGDVQVRKDLNAVSGAGRPKLGYLTADLIKRLEEVLGHNSCKSAIIIGAGRLGNALLGYNGFAEYGLKVSAAFDSAPDKVGAIIGNKEVYPLSCLEDYCHREQVKIAVITVPAEAAQEICDRLVNCGIDAILNFAPCSLTVPENVILQNENLALSLAHLRHQLENK